MRAEGRRFRRARPPSPLVRARRRAATSLVEVLVATVVFLIAVVGVFAHLTFGRIQASIEMRRRYAAEAAHARLEALRTVAYDALPAAEEEGTAVDLDGLAGARTTLVEEVDEDGDDAMDYRRVTVTVRWTENGTDHEVRLVTLRSGLR